MKIDSSYGVEIKNINKVLKPTIKIYQRAISFCIDVFEKEWSLLGTLEDLKQKDVSEDLIHSSKTNIAKYDEFDKKFYKMPLYLRRAVINNALGYLNSYFSNLELWKENGCIGNKPTLRRKHNKLPVFYNSNMYKGSIDSNIAYIKLYINNDWIWYPIKLKSTDMQYIRKHLEGTKMSAPTLEHKNKKWFLRFCFSENVTLNKTKLKEQTILAVDLGLNNDAVCSVMKLDGTVLGRKFINFPSEKDYLYHTLNKIKKVSKLSGSHNTTKLWRTAKLKNEELGRKIAKAIVDYAVSQNVDFIIFEHLDFKGKVSGKKKQKLKMWRKQTIQRIVEHKAHRKGIHINRICAWGTSKLAFNGSGEVERDENNYSLCTFKNNKTYNCDLSASYNIGARYFIKEIQKTTSVKKWSQVLAKVPELQKRTLCTYSTLLSLNKFI